MLPIIGVSYLGLPPVGTGTWASNGEGGGRGGTVHVILEVIAAFWTFFQRVRIWDV
jgi:hypothetical protein